MSVAALGTASPQSSTSADVPLAPWPAFSAVPDIDSLVPGAACKKAIRNRFVLFSLKTCNSYPSKLQTFCTFSFSAASV